MIVCTECGNHNDDDDEFCGSCGRFLEWVGERIAAPPPPAPPPEPEPEPVKVGLVERVKAAVGLDEAAAGTSSPGGGGAPAADIDGTAVGADSPASVTSGNGSAPATGVPSPGVVPAGTIDEPTSEAGTAAEALEREQAEAARQAEERAEQEARAAADAEARAHEETEAARRAEQQARAATETEARAREEAEARSREQAEAARRAEEDAAEVVEGEARARAEAEARQQAEAARRAEEEAEAARRAEEEARARQEAEARARAEAEAREREEAEAARRAEEEAARAKRDAEARAAALLARPRQPAATPPPRPAAATVDGPAGAAVVPSATQPLAKQPAAQQPVAQQPTKAKQAPRPAPKTTTPDRTIKPGDLVCGQCGEGNDPSRKFCRRCGNSLAQAVAAKKLPWWKRIFTRSPKQPKAAGQRKGKSARRAVDGARSAGWRVAWAMAMLRRGLFLLALVGIAVPLAVPSLRNVVIDKGSGAFSSVRRVIMPSFHAVRPIEAQATSSAPDHDPILARDGFNNTYWAEGAEGDGIGQTITFIFDGKVDIDRIVITPGASEPPEAFITQPRPKDLHIVLDNGTSLDVTLKDELDDQGFAVKKGKGVSKVEVTISSVYKSTQGSDTSISEVEFFKKG